MILIFRQLKLRNKLFGLSYINDYYYLVIIIVIIRKAEGYQEGDYTQHTKLTVTEFINDTNYLDRLALASQVSMYSLIYILVCNDV